MKRGRQLLLSKPGALVLAFILAGLIGLLDALTTYEFAVSAVYLIPICWACWRAGRRAGMLLAALCAVIWFIADYVDGHVYKQPVVPYWNAVMLLALFLAVVYSLSAFQEAHRNLLAAQSRLENQNEWLEQTVRQRTSALQSEIAERQRLERAKIEAERLAVVGTMAAEVAHEVRNPLGSITLNLDLIAKQIEQLARTSHHPAEEGRTLVDEMREEVRRIQSVIDDYLQFARLRKPQRKPVELNGFLEQKLTFMGTAFENARVRLHTEFDARLKTVNVDAEQLWQAVLNLVRNSLEAMPGGGALTISTQRRNGEVILSVADTGKGMDEEQLKQLFVPFFTTKRGARASGCRSRSRSSTSTALRSSAPAFSAREPRSRSISRWRKRPDMANKPIILLVDDDERLRNAVTKVLTAEGHRVVCAGSGGEALDRLQDSKRGAGVSDLRLPDLDGIALLKGAREAQPEVEVVVITGHGSVETAVEAMRLGAYDFIEKPIDSAALLKTVAKALEKQRLSQREPATAPPA